MPRRRNHRYPAFWTQAQVLEQADKDRQREGVRHVHGCEHGSKIEFTEREPDMHDERRVRWNEPGETTLGIS